MCKTHALGVPAAKAPFEKTTITGPGKRVAILGMGGQPTMSESWYRFVIDISTL